MRKFITLFKISLGPILMFFSILCLRFEAVYFSPLPKPTANLPGWMEVGVRFLVAVFQASSEEKLAFVCVTWEMTETRRHAPLHHMESGPRSMVTSEERADGTRGKWQITPLCNFITGAMKWSHLTKAFPQDYCGLPSRVCLFSGHLPTCLKSDLQPRWLSDCLGVNSASLPLSVESSDSEPFLKLRQLGVIDSIWWCISSTIF